MDKPRVVAERSCFFFGTFNPVHRGHLLLAGAALDQYAGALGFDAVTFVPAGNPPHRQHDPAILPVAHREAMIRRAIGTSPRLAVSAVEAHLAAQGRVTYTMDTLEALFPQGLPAGRIPVLLGWDAFASLPSWHRLEALCRHVHWLVAPRRGMETGSDAGEKPAIPDFTGQLTADWLDMPLVDVSATRIRSVIVEETAELPAEGPVPAEVAARIARRLAGDLPDAVLAYLLAERLDGFWRRCAL